MRFLIDACLPREFTAEIISGGHIATDVRGIGMGKADDVEIAAYAQANRMILLTEDWGFADIRHYPPEQYFGIAIFETTDNSVDEKVDALRNLQARPEVIDSLPGRLAIVTPSRIRVRPPL